MGYKIDNLVRDLDRVVVNRDRKKTSSYDTTATVTRVKGDTVWIQMPGSDDETPVRRTVDAKAGDTVQVRVSGHSGFLVGNGTAPPTDNTVAYAANNKAVTALGKAVEALDAQLITVKQLQAHEARIENLQADKADVTDLNASNARINTLEANALTADSAIIKSLQTDKANVTDLNASNARINALEVDHVSVDDLNAANGKIANLETGKANVTDLTAANAKIANLETNKANIDLANVNNAWIENGVVKDAAISDAKIIGVSANKLTAGTIDASNITVTNLNADNITTGTINGQRIGEGSLGLNKLSEAVYTETEVDNKLKTMQDEIDGAIETWTGTVVPTLNNEPASKWQNDAAKDKHVGDVYYVVNAGNQADGYCYRFTKSGTTYSWTLIKDSDVTAALQRLVDAEGDIDGLQTFQSTTSSWMTNTDTELSSLKTRTSTVETNLGNKVDTTTFNELSQTVDENSSSITSLNTTVSNKADSSTVATLSNTVNTVSQKANSNESKISNLTTTVDGIDTRVSTAESSITQQATAIESKVSKDGVISTINQSAESVTIDAQKVNIAGAAIFGDYTKTTQMNAAIAAAKADAEKTATNYISVIDNNGIKIHAANNTDVNYAQIDADGMEVFNDSTRRAKFGETTMIGKDYVSGASDNESRMEMDFHSFKMIDKENSKYVYFSDLREKNGQAFYEFLIYGDGITTTWNFPEDVPAIDNTYTVRPNTEYSGTITKYTTKVEFDPAPSKDDEIYVGYYTTSKRLKVFTLGYRSGDGGLGPESIGAGYGVIAEGGYSYAEGYYTTSNGEASHTEGVYTLATAKGSHAQNIGTRASVTGQTAMGTYNSVMAHTPDKYNDLLIVGNGTSDTNRSNAMAVDKTGELKLYFDPDGDDSHMSARLQQLNYYDDTYISAEKALRVKTLLHKMVDHPITEDLSTSYGTIYVSKSFHNVTFVIRGNAVTFNSGWNTLCTLPDRYKPWYYFDIMMYDNQSLNQATAFMPVRFEPDGTVHVWCYTSGKKQIMGSATFPNKVTLMIE